jgi:hypothetical protein
MSQQGFDAELGEVDFGEALDAGFDQFQQAPAPSAPRYRKPGFTIYTLMLALSFLCLLAGMIIMFVDASKY